MAFRTFEVHAGDFKKGKDHQFVGNKLVMKRPSKFFREKIDPSQIDDIDVASEESVKRLGETIQDTMRLFSKSRSRGQTAESVKS